MKKILVGTAIILGLLVGYYLGSSSILQEVSQNLGYGNPSTQALIGSSSDLELLPASKVEASSTSTAGFADGGLLTQEVSVKDFDVVYLSEKSIGGTATSTMYIEPQYSFDGGTTFANISVATTTLEGYSATTTHTLVKNIAAIVPGVATSTQYILPFSTMNADKMRFVIYGTNLASDPNDFIQAWIELYTSEKTPNY